MVVDASVDAHVSAKPPPPTESVRHDHLVVSSGRAMLQVAQQSLLVLRVHSSSRLQQHRNATSTVFCQDGHMLGARTPGILQVQIHKSLQGQLHL
jgi:hypothetical protein